MTARELEEALALLRGARTPHELFGSDPAEAARAYHRMARLFHPDTATDDGRTARAFTTLTALWRAYGRGSGNAETTGTAGTAGTAEATVTTRRNSYHLGPRRARGDLADLYEVTAHVTGAGHRRTGPALLKLPRDPGCNDLLEREAVALRQLARDGDPRYLPYVPRLVESFRHRDSVTGQRRAANVIGTADGFHSLAEVRAAYPDGVDPRDAAWMWRRLLVALGFAHRASVLHGAVLPEHVLIHPEQHGLMLVDWCYSVPGCYAGTDPSGRVPAMVTRYADWYPEEVAGRRPASPATDLAMAARCMLHLMGGQAPPALRTFARGCLLSAQSRRPGDAWRLLQELDEVLERLYGPRRFRPFTMPASA